MILPAVLFVVAAALLVPGVPVLRLVAAAMWLVAAFIAARGWFRLMQARRRN